jgi:putative flippase GtrA
MKFFVFKSYKSNAQKEFARFVIVNILSAMLVILASNAAVMFISLFLAIGAFEYFLAHLIGVGAPIFFSFLLHKNFTFKSNFSE